MHLPSRPEVLVDNTLSNQFTVVEVSGLDRPGLLYELTNTLSDLNLDITSAHITTFGEKAVDVFYVTDLTNKQIASPQRQKAIKARLMSVLGAHNDAVGRGALVLKTAQSHATSRAMSILRLPMMIFVFGFLVPLAAHAAWWLSHNEAVAWHEADWSSVGLLPPARARHGRRGLCFRGSDWPLEGHIRAPLLDRHQGARRLSIHPLRHGGVG